MSLKKKWIKFLFLSLILCCFFSIFILSINHLGENVHHNNVPNETNDEITVNFNQVGVNSLGMSEYECFGTCVCENDHINDRRSSLSKGISTVILSISSVVAYSMAKEWFLDECFKNNFGEDCLYISSEVDSCDRIDGNVWSTVDEEFEEFPETNDKSSSSSSYISVCTEHEDGDENENDSSSYIQNMRRKLLFEYLDTVLKDEHVTHEHLAAFTCELADEHSHHLFPTDEKKKHYFLKNLFLLSKKDNIKFLVIAHHHTNIRMNHVSRELGLSNKKKRLRFGELEDMMDTLLVGRGSCTGFALFPTGMDKEQNQDITAETEKQEKIVLYKKEEIEKLKNLKLIIDSKLLEEEEEEDVRIVLHPLMNTASTSITQEDFLRFVKSCNLNEDPIVYKFDENKVEELP